MSPEEGLLRDILGLRRVPEHAEGEPVDAVLLGPNELLERPTVTRPEPAHELRGIACRRLSHGCRHPRPEPSADGDARTS